ncbi:hypothetical protein BH11MYX3_BH11MYX3_39230 [soil metagenome]
MTKRGATPLIVLGMGALGLGIWFVNDANQFHYDETGSHTGVAIAAAGAILLGLGIAKLTRPIVWPIVIVLGLAYPVFAWRSAASAGAAKQAREAADAEMAKTLAAVCQGTPVPSAAPLAEHGLRPTLMSRTGDDNYLEELDASWKPREVAQAQLVACANMTKSSIEPCMYEGGITVQRNRYTMELTVREARTANVLGARKFEGDPPNCIDEVKTRVGQTTHSDFDGLSPMAGDWKPWLTYYVVAK